ncbi:MAG: hypothetical protein WAO24_03165 [Peptococcia bacterium]
MKLLEMQQLLKARCHTNIELDHKEINSCCGADLLSDVLAFTKANSLLLTGLIHPQVIRTAEMLDLVAIVFVRDKAPSSEMIALAEERQIPLFSTDKTMYEACGLLYSNGLN